MESSLANSLIVSKLTNLKQYTELNATRYRYGEYRTVLSSSVESGQSDNPAAVTDIMHSRETPLPYTSPCCFNRSRPALIKIKIKNPLN